ncbi:MAG: 16S rRNA (uracil(1498)-N(3))-methyltransferase [Eubacteriales bacterium]|nr:16S rRNA (uracil(1498)-N(3))-methyltransferase [Eubacteriales bacterium]
MFRFFVEQEQINDGQVVIIGEDVNHIRNVLRMKPGETVLIAAGDDWEYTCDILALDENQVLLKITDAQKPGKELPSRIYLFQCLPKGDKMETVIQKAVELGAYEVIPVASKRCIMKLDEKKKKTKVNRWNGIAESAAKQSKRMIIPEVHAVLSFKEALRYAADIDVKLLPYENAEGMAGTRRLLEGIAPGQSVAVMIGPEGGFDPAEVEEAAEAGFSAITLGKRILRTETAGMTALSILMYHLEQD